VGIFEHLESIQISFQKVFSNNNSKSIDNGRWGTKPSRRNDVSPPHQIFSDSKPRLEWKILSQTIPGTLADPHTGSVSRLLAWFCAKLCLQTKTLIFNVLLIFAATNQCRDLWGSPPCFDGTDHRSYVIVVSEI